MRGPQPHGGGTSCISQDKDCVHPQLTICQFPWPHLFEPCPTLPARHDEADQLLVAVAIVQGRRSPGPYRLGDVVADQGPVVEQHWLQTQPPYRDDAKHAITSTQHQAM
jgi:hypothetical protein